MGILYPQFQTTIQVVEKFAQFDNTMQANAMLALLYIAKYQNRPEGVTTRDLEKWLGISNASASRNVHLWGEGTKDSSTSGFGLVVVKVDPVDRRKRSIRLTSKGEAFINQMEALYG